MPLIACFFPMCMHACILARLHSDRERESGFYTGKIEAVDFVSNKYWVTFDRPGVGKHLINDTEIKVQ